jgi:hypothetical protein
MAGHIYPFAGAWERRHIGVVLFGLFLSGCGGSGQTWGTMTETDKNDLACNEYGFYPGTQQYDDCVKYVVAKRSQRPNFPAID